MGVKTEVKNMNSFHGVRKALEFEIDRLQELRKNNATVREEEIELLKEIKLRLEEAFESAELNLDSIRLIF